MTPPPPSNRPAPRADFRERQAYERLQRRVRAQLWRMRRLGASRTAARP